MGEVVIMTSDYNVIWQRPSKNYPFSKYYKPHFYLVKDAVDRDDCIYAEKVKDIISIRFDQSDNEIHPNNVILIFGETDDRSHCFFKKYAEIFRVCLGRKEKINYESDKVIIPLDDLSASDKLRKSNKPWVNQIITELTTKKDVMAYYDN